MTTDTRVPFMRERDAEGRFVHPPLHLRPWTAAELEQHRRMIRGQELGNKLLLEHERKKEEKA